MVSLRNRINLLHLRTGNTETERVPKDSGGTRHYHDKMIASENERDDSSALVHHQRGNKYFC